MSQIQNIENIFQDFNNNDQIEIIIENIPSSNCNILKWKLFIQTLFFQKFNKILNINYNDIHI